MCSSKIARSSFETPKAAVRKTLFSAPSMSFAYQFRTARSWCGLKRVVTPAGSLPSNDGRFWSLASLIVGPSGSVLSAVQCSR